MDQSSSANGDVEIRNEQNKLDGFHKDFSMPPRIVWYINNKVKNKVKTLGTFIKL